LLRELHHNRSEEWQGLWWGHLPVNELALGMADRDLRHVSNCLLNNKQPCPLFSTSERPFFGRTTYLSALSLSVARSWRQSPCLESRTEGCALGQ
jgi:hypothetical protein